MYIDKLMIKDLRCFEETVIELWHPKTKRRGKVEYPNVNLLLGNNGAGKTTVLKALALGVLSRVLHMSGYRPYHMVRKDSAGEASITAQVRLGSHERAAKGKTKRDPVTLTTELVRHGEYEEVTRREGGYMVDLFKEYTPAFFMVGYGSTRRVTGEDFTPSSELKERGARLQRVWGLFQDGVGLTPLTAWLPYVARENKAHFQEILSLFGRFLPAGLSFRGELAGDARSRRQGAGTTEYLFEDRGRTVPLGALSDGCRTYVGWVADLLFQMYRCATPSMYLSKMEGLLLVDEVDLHLHPSWQREVLPTIARALPRMQIVCTTHSPIVAGTLHREQVFTLEPDGKYSKVGQLEERLHGMNADQILTSSYFGLETTRAPGFVDKLTKLRAEAWKGDENATVTLLREMTPDGGRGKKGAKK